MQNIQSYVQQHQDRFIKELLELLKIPSISADPAYKKDIVKTAAEIKKRLQHAGCDHGRNLRNSRIPHCVWRKNDRS